MEEGTVITTVTPGMLFVRSTVPSVATYLSPEGTIAAGPTSASIINVTATADGAGGGITASVIGVIAAVLLALIVLAVVLLRYMSSQKGSYLTNELNDDEESVDSQRALQGDTDMETVEEK